MEGLSKYFQKIKLVLQDKTEEKNAIKQSIRENTGVDVSLDSMTLKNFVVSLELSPIERVEVSMKKKVIIEELKQKGVILTDLK